MYGPGEQMAIGDSLIYVTLIKMKHLLRPRFSRRRTRNVRRLHLHLDGPTIVILQKRREQAGRDSSRGTVIEVEATGAEEWRYLCLLLPITAPWSTLVRSRKRRDVTFKLHLFCEALAAIELAKETNV